MRAEKKIEKLVEEKRAEVLALERKLGEAKAYLEALSESLKLISKHGGGASGGGDVLRPGSAVCKARDALRKAGKPLHVSDLLKAIGKDPTKKARISLGGSLSTYVRNKAIFTRPAPNTFGLEEFDAGTVDGEEPPDGFGQDDAV